MPISRFQSAVLRVLAAQRSPDSYVAGGVAINRDGPRFPGDIDIFQDSGDRLDHAVAADGAALSAAGYRILWDPPRAGRRETTIALGADEMRLEWAVDAAFRFFPAQPDLTLRLEHFWR